MYTKNRNTTEKDVYTKLDIITLYFITNKEANSMKKVNTLTLEEQIKSLQEQIDFLKSGGTSVSPSKRLQHIRSQCRERHFGSWADIRNGRVDYGPENKSYSDYDVIRDIVVRITDLIFRYSKGKRAGTTITTLIKSEEDFKEYENICENVCCRLENELKSL